MDCRELTFLVVFTTERPDIHVHEPLRLRDGVNGYSTTPHSFHDVHPHLQVLKKTIPLSEDLVRRLREHKWIVDLSTGFKTSRGKRKSRKLRPPEEHLEILCQFAIRYDNRYIQVGVQVCPPEDIEYQSK
jgi:hypothetical protein